MSRNTLLVALVALTMVAGLANAVRADEQLQIEGSTTVGPIAVAFAEAFKTMYPDLKISIKQTGSGNGAAALLDGRCDIATMSRFMKAKEFKAAVEKGVMPVAHVVAMDGVCIIVHPSNPVPKRKGGLTLQEIKDIYTGKITNWKQLGGNDAKIIPITRDNASGTFETFEGLVMKKAPMASNVETVNSNPQAKNRVKTTPNAIAYVGLGFVDRSVRALDVNKIAPTRRTIAKGTYPIARPLYMFTNGYPKLGSMAHAFCTFHLSEKGQDIIVAKGFVPVTDY